jgi:hypothetical protein
MHPHGVDIGGHDFPTAAMKPKAAPVLVEFHDRLPSGL